MRAMLKPRPRFFQAGFIDTRKAGLLGSRHIRLLVALGLTKNVNGFVYAGSKLMVILSIEPIRAMIFPV
jgi:hypothetical protein